ncbi:MAG: OmpA family protein [Rubricella sp.]
MFWNKMRAATAAIAVTAALAACSTDELGSEATIDSFGVANAQNRIAQLASLNGDRFLRDLAEEFERTTPTTVNFAFNSALLDANARRILDEQAAFLRANPAAAFEIEGHTDLVGTEGYNERLGLQRASAAVAYLVGQGISEERLFAVVSFGETQPIVDTAAPERRNRRAETRVAGIDSTFAGYGFDGRRAVEIYNAYVGAEVADSSSVTEASSAPGAIE